VGLRFNPPPGWPPAPEGFVPPPGWQPDPAWPPPPPGWVFWTPDDAQDAPEPAGQAAGDGQPSPGQPTPGQPYPPGPPPSGQPHLPGQPYPPGQPGYRQAAAGGQPYATGYPPGQPPPGQAYPPGPPPYGQAYPGQPGYGQPTGYPSPPAGRVNGFAIASFVLGLAGFMLVTLVLSVVFGIVALAGIRRTGGRGRGLAIAGLVLSGVWVLLFAVIIAIGAATSPQHSSATGHVSHTVAANVSAHHG
jgi:Domain of unknown function (DUF4190)